MSQYKNFSALELQKKKADYEKTIAIMETAGVALMPEISEAYEAIKAELATREGEIVLSRIEPALKSAIEASLRGSDGNAVALSTAVVFEGLISYNEETKQLDISFAAKKKASARSTEKSGSKSEKAGFSSDKMHVISHAKFGTKEFESAQKALDFLREQKLVQPDYGSSDSAVRVLNRCKANGLIADYASYSKEEAASAIAPAETVNAETELPAAPAAIVEEEISESPFTESAE